MSATRSPECRTCGKALVWEARWRWRRGKRVDRAAIRRHRALRAREAIRCLYCEAVFCKRCARRHFAPIHRAARLVDEALATFAMRSLRAVLTGRKIA